MPDVITPNSASYLATSLSYDADIRPTQTTAPNSATSLTYYDSAGRVVETKNAAGGETAFTYGIDTGTRMDTTKTYPSTSPSSFTFGRTIYDGLGRPIKSEAGGSDWAVKTTTETEYEPCACSPTGKMKRVSLPYGPGGTVQWTTYTYDALGRTLNVTLPGGSGTTSYEYVKNTVKITDAAGKWKKYETDGLGQLVKVIEPNPAGGSDLETLYAYNIRGQMTTATMTRAGTTQVRTFAYNLTTGRLESVTKPETGTTSYTYNTDGTVQSTVDAKDQKTEFTYDSLKRVTNVKRFLKTGGVYVEQPCQEVLYYYDQNPDTYATYNLRGSLAKVTAKQCDSVVTSYSEIFEYETSGLLLQRDSQWKRYNYVSYFLTRRVDPTWNQMGLMTDFGYGTSGSLYNYSYTYDNAWRPATMTGEGLTLVNGISYNAAGAMTAFTRNDGSGTNVNNSYVFNDLYQMTNQTVTKGGTTLQNLSYTFSSTQNNGQILSQSDALSGETVEYQYDSLNRLISAATTDTSWGLSFAYDGFGNRTNQTVTKGSGPTHSVAIDPATNRISTSGYTYDNNGNMTQMPQLTMSYDVANRMTTSNHASAGTQLYGYNHANQRVFVRNGNTVTYYLYGLGGERLMEFEETCISGACGSYTETQRWIYFAGRKMFSKTGTTLKAITPNRLASEAKHFPYGETDGTPPADTKDYFATYRRDGTGLDYAWNRYYSPTMGRFTTADPYEGSVSLGNPHSWNRYTYTDNNPVNYLDPTGLLTVNEIQALIGSVLNNVAPNIPMTIHVQAGLEALATNTVMLYHFSSYIGWSSQLPFMQNSSSSQPVPRPGTLMVKNLKKDGFHFDRVFERIHDLMNTINKDCLNFLESGGTSAQEYTQALLDNNLLATGQFDNTIAAFNGTGGSDVPEGYAAIVVNTDGAFFNSGFTIPGSNSTAGTARAQASILLHELAHGLGSSGFLPDRNNKNAGKQNNEMIEKNCGGTLSEFDNRITSN